MLYGGEYGQIISELRKFIGNTIRVETVYIPRKNKHLEYTGILLEVHDNSDFFIENGDTIKGTYISSCATITDINGIIIFE